MYASFRESKSVLRFNGSTGDLIDTFVASGSGGLNTAFGLLFGSDGNLYVNSVNTHGLLRYDGGTGAFIDAFVAPDSGANNRPTALMLGPDNNLYGAFLDSSSVLRFNGASGDLIDTFVASGSGGLDLPFGLVFIPANSNPTADGGGPYVINEGLSLLLNASGSSDPDGDLLSFSWDVNGDGIFGDAIGATPTLTWAQLNALGITDNETPNGTPRAGEPVNRAVSPRVLAEQGARCARSSRTHARARGRNGGRPKVTSAETKVVLAKKLHQDKSIEIDDICTTLRISRSTFYRYVQLE